ncbi:hypothetical protein U0X36_05240 [Bacillus thuringiensis]|uniref:hypothetical protein n=1 Tax=Bacillus thuringiensis TaxID=1428 RepID=UPI000E525BFE|nr:hypothetical protein [Bacillus thuringiensis]MDZ3952352.1 hypothetical protein [Bacillus thuringiensis]RGP45187.1 hypothetical protein BTW32_25750 [Bacillus thuringiensis]
MSKANTNIEKSNAFLGGDEEVAALVVDNGSGMCKAGFAGDDALSLTNVTITDITVLSIPDTTAQIDLVGGNGKVDNYNILQDSMIIIKSNNNSSFPGIAVAFIPGAITKNVEDLACFIKNCLLPNATIVNTYASKIVLTATESKQTC